MAETTGIEWCDATWNPWIGCTKVSPACDLCYAWTYDRRWGGLRWGPKAPRTRTADSNWKKPPSWARHPLKLTNGENRRPRIFGGSLCDPFDNHVSILPEWRADYWNVIRRTPELDWLILTKRPQNIRKMLPRDWGEGWPHVWLGTTVENQKEADRRIPKLLSVPAAVRFLSCEPLLERVDLLAAAFNGADSLSAMAGIDWVIVGGESGHGARMMHEEWALDLLHQCRLSGTAYFFKQMTHKAAIPPAMLIREFPRAA